MRRRQPPPPEIIELDVDDESVDLEVLRLAREELEQATAKAADTLAALHGAITAGQEWNANAQQINEILRKDAEQLRAEIEEVKKKLADVTVDLEGEVVAELRRRLETIEGKLMDGHHSRHLDAPYYMPMYSASQGPHYGRY